MKKLLILALLLLSDQVMAAFTNSVTDKVFLGGGYIQEYGTFTCASIGGENLTASTSAAYAVGDLEITNIERWGFASDGDLAVKVARDTAPNVIKVRCAATTDTGDYYIIGKGK